MTDLSKEAADDLVGRLHETGLRYKPCQQAADYITAMRAENEALRQQIAAAEAAAYERAAKNLSHVAENWDCGCDPRYCRCREAAEPWGIAADEIRALITPEAASALAAREAAAHRAGKLEGLREAMAEVKSWFKENEFDPFSVHLAALAERIEKGVE